MGKLTIGCFSSLVGSLSLDVAVQLSDAAVKKGQKSFKDYSHLAKPVQELLATGKFQITACEACAAARGYHKEDTMEGVKSHSMDWYLASTFDADRVLHMGGD